jgi:hypothetical protein
MDLCGDLNVFVLSKKGTVRFEVLASANVTALSAGMWCHTVLHGVTFHKPILFRARSPLFNEYF